MITLAWLILTLVFQDCRAYDDWHPGRGRSKIADTYGIILTETLGEQ